MTDKGNGDGGPLVAIGEKDGQVIMTFSSPIQWLPMDAENARQIAEQLARSAYKARFGKEPYENRSYITDTIRQGLHARATLIIRSMTTQGKKSNHIASQVVDEILKEIT